MKQVQNCSEYTLRRCTFENVAVWQCMFYYVGRLQNTGKVEVVILLLCIINFLL